MPPKAKLKRASHRSSTSPILLHSAGFTPSFIRQTTQCPSSLVSKDCLPTLPPATTPSETLPPPLPTIKNVSSKRPISKEPTIICISDDEDDVHVPAKRARLNEDSNVEIVDTFARPPKDHTKTSTQRYLRASPSIVIVDDIPSQPRATFKLSQPLRASPSLVILDEPPSSSFPKSTPPPSQSDWGEPTLLAEPPMNRPYSPPPTSDVTPSPPASGPAPPRACTPPPEMMVNDVENVWETGDDELVAEGYERDEDVADEDTLVDQTLEEDRKGRECPVCEKWFSQEVIDAHVNMCIDSLTEETSTNTSSQPAPSSTSSPTKFTITNRLPLSTPSPTKGTNAFSVLMSSFKQKEAWKEAAVAEDRSFRPTKANGGRRKAPFYKVMTGMPIAVDAFRYGTIPGVTAYFLTHAHSDHYTNLSSNWKSGLIYCSEGTANLIIHMLNVDRRWVRPLPMDVTTVTPNTGGVKVTLIEANHCPGSSLFLFEGPQTVNAGDSTFLSPFVGSNRIYRYLHCGDFRACPQHVLHPGVKGKRLDVVYLDTTYMDPKYVFPPQPLVISACAELAKRIVNHGSAFLASEDDSPKHTVDNFFMVQPKAEEEKVLKARKTLVVVGTYSIGKERIVKAIAHALETKVYCDKRKAAILRCQSDPELHALLTDKPAEAGVHLVPLNVVSNENLKDYLARWNGHFTHIIGFRPTGWTFTPPNGSDTLPTTASVISRAQKRGYTHADLRPGRGSNATVMTYGVPYSEHSSFFELTCFALSLDWDRIIATVNLGERSRAKMDRWFSKWATERRKGSRDIIPHRRPDYW